MARIKGVVVGLVVDVNDPNGEGRIRVEFPWMGGQNKSYWAPVATLMTGNGRGSWFMPEVGDEVLVAFEHEDADHPFVLGFLWNGQDKPPETSSHKRLLKSVKGHTILLDDSDGDEKIEITTGKGLKITMDDTSNSITIQASDSITVKGTNQVTVQAPTVKVDAEKIQLGGDAAIYSAVWGEVLYAYLQELYTAITTHMHVGELALGIFPVTPMVGVPPPLPVPLKPLILSNVVKEA
jgi:phage baseplate assembly protein V